MGSKIKDIKDYLMALGTSQNRAEEIIDELLNNNELDEFYINIRK